MSSDLFAPDGGWRVRIRDHSAPAEDNVIEEVSGFPTLMQANAFACRYVRDSVERCRAGADSPSSVINAWLTWGEDAEVVDAAEAGWHSGPELEHFAASPAEGEARDWRALDPRRASDETPGEPTDA